MRFLALFFFMAFSGTQAWGMGWGNLVQGKGSAASLEKYPLCVFKFFFFGGSGRGATMSGCYETDTGRAACKSIPAGQAVHGGGNGIGGNTPLHRQHPPAIRAQECKKLPIHGGVGFHFENFSFPTLWGVRERTAEYRLSA